MGDSHACAITASKGVMCWGRNNRGQLGDGTTTNRIAPVDTGLSDVVEISTQYNHTCARTSAGKVYCWGRNSDGQIGDGTTTNVLAPFEVPGLTNVTSVAAGYQHTCVVDGGAVKCWGDNNYGTLGDGSKTDSTTPVTAISSGAATVAASYFTTCALLTTHKAKCWGTNDIGEVGNLAAPTGGGPANVTSPIDVDAVSGDISALSQGYNRVCVVMKTDQSAKCWGRGDNGELGNGSNPVTPSAVQVTGLTSGVAAISGSESMACALTTSGAVSCWGKNPAGLGDGTSTTSNVPVPVLASGARAISAGPYSGLAVMSDGTLRCWGSNGYGQLATGDTTDVPSPVACALGLTMAIPPTTTTTTTTIAANTTTTTATSTTAAPGGVDESGKNTATGSGTLPKTGSTGVDLFTAIILMMAGAGVLLGSRRLKFS